MHVLPYETKRAHWRMTWWAIRLFRKWAVKLEAPELADMTPARYDILFTIWQRPRWHRRKRNERYELTYTELATKLHLHASTISKCVKGLIELGFATRHPEGKAAWVRLTKLGVRMLEMAIDVLFGRGQHFHAANATFAVDRARTDDPNLTRGGEGEIDAMLLAFGRRVRQCAWELGSRAWRVYDPCFDDPVFPYRFPLSARARSHHSLPGPEPV